MKTKCSYCGKEITRKPSEIKKHQNLYCSKDCLKKHKSIIYTNNNPNKQYYFDNTFFENIDSEFKAWLLGWIASDGCVNQSGFTIAIDKKDIDVLKKIQENFCKDIPIKKKKNTSLIYYTVNSKKISEDICSLLQIKPEKKSYNVQFPNIAQQYQYHFMRGYFEGDGCIRKPSVSKRSPECDITSNSDNMLIKLGELSNVPNIINLKHHNINWYGVNCLDFLGKLYDNCQYYMLRKKETFEEWCCWQPITSGYNKIDNAIFVKTSPKAVTPNKSRISDSGYDLTLIEKLKENGEVQFFDTGIRVQPPFGYYFDLVPRSSISKTGYILANNVGIIDRAYSGNIIVPLIKIDKNKPDIELPCRLVQLIPRAIQHFEFTEAEELNKTDRGDGGFGSTGSK